MPELLQYGRPPVPDHREIVLSAILGGGAGILLTIVVVGGLVVGNLPGSARIARVALPYTVLGASLPWSGHWIYWPVLVSAIVQYPLYGAFCGAAVARGRFWKALGIVAAFHVVAVVAAAFV
jgi:hypothetical protein